MSRSQEDLYFDCRRLWDHSLTLIGVFIRGPYNFTLGALHLYEPLPMANNAWSIKPSTHASHCTGANPSRDPAPRGVVREGGIRGNCPGTPSYGGTPRRSKT